MSTTSDIRNQIVAGTNITYDSSTGVISSSGIQAADVRNQLVAGPGISYDSATGVITNTATDTTRSDSSIRALITASGSIQYDSVRTNTSPIIFDETTVESKLKSTSGANLILRAASNLFGYSTGDQYYDSPQVKETSFVNAPIDRYVEALMTIYNMTKKRWEDSNKNPLETMTFTPDFNQVLTLEYETLRKNLLKLMYGHLNILN